MEKLEKIKGLFAVTAILFLIIVNHKGFLYDVIKKKYNNNYNDKHSFSWMNAKIWFSLPLFINDKQDIQEVQNAKRTYNKFSIIFWGIVALIAIIYIIQI